MTYCVGMQIDAGLIFIGRIETPWTLRAECPRAGDPDNGPDCRLVLDPRWQPALFSHLCLASGLPEHPDLRQDGAPAGLADLALDPAVGGLAVHQRDHEILTAAGAGRPRRGRGHGGSGSRGTV